MFLMLYLIKVLGEFIFIKYLGLFFGINCFVCLIMLYIIGFGLFIDSFFIVYFGKLRLISFLVFCFFKFLYFLFWIILNSVWFLGCWCVFKYLVVYWVVCLIEFLM